MLFSFWDPYECFISRDDAEFSDHDELLMADEEPENEDPEPRHSRSRRSTNDTFHENDLVLCDWERFPLWPSVFIKYTTPGNCLVRTLSDPDGELISINMPNSSVCKFTLKKLKTSLRNTKKSSSRNRTSCRECSIAMHPHNEKVYNMAQSTDETKQYRRTPYENRRCKICRSGVDVSLECVKFLQIPEIDGGLLLKEQNCVTLAWNPVTSISTVGQKNAA